MPVSTQLLTEKDFNKTIEFFPMMQPAIVGDLTFAQAVIRDVAEGEPYDPSADDALCISVGDLEALIDQRLMWLARKPVPQRAD